MTGQKYRVWEVTLDGFDGSTDHTDDRVVWVKVPAGWNARDVAIALLDHHKGAKALEPEEVDIPLDMIAEDAIDMVLS